MPRDTSSTVSVLFKCVVALAIIMWASHTRVFFLFEFAILPVTFDHTQSKPSAWISFWRIFCGRRGKLWHLVAFGKLFRNTLKCRSVLWTLTLNNCVVGKFFDQFRIDLFAYFSCRFLGRLAWCLPASKEVETQTHDLDSSENLLQTVWC